MNAKPLKARQSALRPTKNLQRSKEREAAGSAVNGRGTWILLLVLLLATLAAYQPAWHGGMLWDDDSHITRRELQSGQGVWRIWFDLNTTQQYYPAVHSVFWVLHKFWGDDTLGYHLINILLHALCAFLFAVILRWLKVPGAFLAAIIFALHPVHVESVAWISELKNTLSSLLYLGAMLAYLRFDRGRQERFYALAMALFVMALLSKTVTATLPAALLVVFWWQRGRVSWRRDALPLVPLFVIAAAGGLFTAWIERTMIGAHGAEFRLSLIERSLIAGRAVWFYLGKLAWPANLIFIYPRWQISASAWWQYLYPLGVAAMLIALWLWRNRSRAPLAALLLFCGTLFPALGFFNVYPFRYSFVADHFQYLASLPIIALFSAGMAHLASRWKIHPKAAAATFLVLGLLPGILTWNQSRQYIDAEALYRTTLGRNPACWLAHINLGILELNGAPAEAETHFKEALRLKPDLAEAHINLGILAAHGNIQAAEEHLREALRLKPDSAEARNNLGFVLQSAGRFDEAEAQLKEALRLNPEYADAHYNLGNALLGRNRFEEAVVQYEGALKLVGDSAEAYNGLGYALQHLDRLDEAAKCFQKALRLRPDYPDACYNLGNALHAMNRLEEAVAQYLEAGRLKPDFAEAFNNLGATLQGMGRMEEAATYYREALQLRPNYPEAQANLDRILPHLRK